MTIAANVVSIKQRRAPVKQTFNALAFKLRRCRGVLYSPLNNTFYGKSKPAGKKQKLPRIYRLLRDAKEIKPTIKKLHVVCSNVAK